MKVCPVTLTVCILLLGGLEPAGSGEAPRTEAPLPARDGYWVEPMNKVHARFTGEKGTFAHFGDSITFSRAFWTPLAGTPKNMPPEIAREQKVPLIDYFGEILKRRPEDWDGSLPRFNGLPGDEYQVPTLIARDGVHPSNPALLAGDFSDAALHSSGYGLRNYLTLMAYAEVIERVLQPQK